MNHFAACRSSWNGMLSTVAKVADWPGRLVIPVLPFVGSANVVPGSVAVPVDLHADCPSAVFRRRAPGRQQLTFSVQPVEQNSPGEARSH